MPHRFIVRACAGLCAALAVSACDRSPTDPSRPGRYEVTFLGLPAGAGSFTPRALSAGRVVGAARVNGAWRAVQWSGGVFAPIGPPVPPACDSEAVAAHGPFTVGQVTCYAAVGDEPNDALGWATGVGALPQLFGEPYGFVDVNGSALIAGTVNPRAQFPRSTSRAFLVSGATTTVLVPPGAVSSEAVGVSDAGAVAVTGHYVCVPEDDDCAPSRVWIWSAGGWTEVPLPDGATAAVGAAVSSAGHVAGYTLGGGGGVFLWEIEDEDLDLLPVVPGTRVQITGVNALGQIVGTGIRNEPASGQQPSYGIIWGDERMYNLTERVTGPIDWQVTSAMGTDDEGRIAGTAVNPETGQEGAVLLIPFGV